MEQASSLGIENYTLYSLFYRERVMVLQVGLILNQSVNRATVKNLLLIERKSGQEFLFPFHILDSQGDNSLLQTELDFLAYPGMDTEECVWDLYISVESGDDRRTFRMKRNTQRLEMLLFSHSEWNHSIVPYSTDQGNVSFRVEEKKIFAGIEEAVINKKNITIQGYAFYPLDDSGDEDIEKHLILRDEEGETEKRISIEWPEDKKTIDDEERSNLEGSYDWTWFQAECDLGELQFAEGAGRMKFFMIVESGSRVMESAPIELKAEAAINMTVINTKNRKQKINLKGKVNRSLSLSVSAHNVWKESYSSVKKKFLRVKRGKKAEKVYKFLFRTSAALLPKKNNLVMFESFSGKQYSCNPRAIYEYMQKHYRGYTLCWSVGKRYEQLFRDHQVPYVKRFSLKWLWYMPRAKYWIINSRLPLWVPKPPGTIYLQTWHGTPLKRLAADMEEVHMPGTSSSKYKKNFIKAAKKWDYLISPNAYSSVIFWRAFRFNGTIVETGYPRNDYLYAHNHTSSIAEIRQRCGIPLDKKVILYAPTWRDDQFYGKGRYKFNLDLDLEQMQQELGSEYVVLLRMHYLVAENLDLTAFDGFAYDFSDYEDIRDLYLVSDLLVTDYSSVFFDYANLYRPIIFYTYDLDRYRDKLRGFYFDLEEKAPGPLVKTTEDVIAAIRGFEQRNFEVPGSFKSFYERFCYLEDGDASARAVEALFFGDVSDTDEVEKHAIQSK